MLDFAEALVLSPIECSWSGVVTHMTPAGRWRSVVLRAGLDYKYVTVLRTASVGRKLQSKQHVYKGSKHWFNLYI